MPRVLARGRRDFTERQEVSANNAQKVALDDLKNEKGGVLVALDRALQSIFLLRSRLPHDAGFVLGAMSAALLVLTIAGAGFTLSFAATDLSKKGHYRLPPPALSLAAVPSNRA